MSETPRKTPEGRLQERNEKRFGALRALLPGQNLSLTKFLDSLEKFYPQARILAKKYPHAIGLLHDTFVDSLDFQKPLQIGLALTHEEPDQERVRDEIDLDSLCFLRAFGVFSRLSGSKELPANEWMMSVIFFCYAGQKVVIPKTWQTLLNRQKIHDILGFMRESDVMVRQALIDILSRLPLWQGSREAAERNKDRLNGQLKAMTEEFPDLEQFSEILMGDPNEIDTILESKKRLLD